MDNMPGEVEVKESESVKLCEKLQIDMWTLSRYSQILEKLGYSLEKTKDGKPRFTERNLTVLLCYLP